MSYYPYGKPPAPAPADGYRPEFPPLRHVANLIPPSDPTIPLTDVEYTKHQRYDWYQRCWLHGFTIQELRDSGCWSKADAKPSNLKQKVHPLFEKVRWETRGTVDIDPSDQEKGKWEYGNNVVREAIMPSLRLASLLLTNSAFWPFVDALLFGEWKLIPPDSIKDGCPPESSSKVVYSFHPRDPTLMKTERAKQLQAFQDLSERLTIRIESAIGNITKDPSRALVGASHRAHWEDDGTYRRSSLRLMMELITPLLRDDLTVSERLAQQFSLARMICHETIHGMGALALHRRNMVKSAEPFYEDEAICELGRAWENVTFGGWGDHLHHIDRRNFSEPVLGETVMDWPNWAIFGPGRYIPSKRRRYRHHHKFRRGATFDFWPSQMDFIENIQQDSWWRTQTKYQAAAFRSARVFGRRYVKGGESIKILGPDYDAWIGPNGQQVVEPPFPPDANDIKKWEIEQQRRVRVHAIKTLVRRQQEDLDVLIANTEQLELDKAKEGTEEEQKELDLLQAAADLYDASDQTSSYGAYLPLSLSKSLAIKSQALVAIAEMQHFSQDDVNKLRDRGLAFLKTYQDENPGSEVAMKVEAAIKKLMETGRLRRDAAKEN